MPRGPAPSQGGSRSRSGPLSAVCHAGLVVPAPGILELPSLPFLHSFIHPLLLGFVCTDIVYLSHTHKHTHRHTFLSPPLSFPQHWAPSSQLGARCQHAACLFVPHFPFLVVTGPPPSLYSWGSQQTLLLLMIMGGSKTNRSNDTDNKACPQGLGVSVWPASQGCL